MASNYFVFSFFKVFSSVKEEQYPESFMTSCPNRKIQADAGVDRKGRRDILIMTMLMFLMMKMMIRITMIMMMMMIIITMAMAMAMAMMMMMMMMMMMTMLDCNTY